MRRAVFLDRDGTILDNGDDVGGYPHKIEHFRILPGVVEGLRRLQNAGYLLVVVTNQSGIGRGIFKEDDYQTYTRHMLREFSVKDVKFDGVYYCPHRPEEGCECRKPGIGMLVRAGRELGVELNSKSWMVGDDKKDIEAGCKAGLSVVKVGKDMNFDDVVDKILGE